MDWEYKQAVKTVFGEGKVRASPMEVKNFSGTKELLITSCSFVTKGLAQQIAEESDGLIKQIYSEVSTNPDVTEEVNKHPNLKNNPIPVTEDFLCEMYNEMR